MIKCIGAGMILISAIILGNWPTIMMYKREQSLRQWGRVLQRIKGELRTNLPDIPTLLRNSIIDSDAECAAVITAVLQDIDTQGAAMFSDSWRNHILQHCRFLHTPETAAICDLGSILGNYIPEDEIQAIERVYMLVCENMRVCCQQRKEQTKLYMGTAISLGLILVVVLF